MQAVRCEAFGETPVLGETPQREPGAGQVRVRVAYSSIGAGDALMANGRPWVFRPVFSALLTPPVLGRDVAGVVEAVGEGVEGVAVGDRVIGEAGAAWAEQTCVAVGALAGVPEGVELREAATLPVSATTALQGLRLGGVGEGTRLLIIGASGGVGHFAVQIGALLGAHVTGVCSGAKADRVRALGAKQVIDHATTRYVDSPERWDVVFDLVGDQSVGACLDLLAPGGRYVSSAGSNGGPWLGPIPRLLQVLLRSFVDRRIAMLNTAANPADFGTLLGWLAEGRITPWIGQEVELEGAPAALQAVAAGRMQGKCVVRVG